MASTYSTNLRIELMADGENSNTWGGKTNTNLTMLEQAVSGVASVAMTDADYTLTTSNAATDEARNMVVTMTGTLTQARNVIVPSVDKVYVLKNSTTGGFAVTVKTSGGTGISVANGETETLYCDATNVLRATTNPTGTGAPVRANSPTLVTPNLGTPASGTLTNCTGLPTAGLVDEAVTYAKMQNVSATDKLLGRSTAGAGDVEEIACTTAGRAILDDADAAAQRVTLGLVIGTNVQAYDADLTAIAGLTSAANKVPMFSGSGTATLIDFKDEDNMASDSATAVPSQQSVKAYVDAATSGGITMGTPVASTSGTSVDFTGIPATAKRITVNFKGVSTSGSSNVVVQIGDSDGVENTGYLGGGLGINSAMGGTGANATDGFPLDMNHGASSLLHGSMVISMESSVNNTWCSMSIVSVTTGGFYVLFGSGSKSLSGVLDRVRITTQGGSDTFDAGEINISYE